MLDPSLRQLERELFLAAFGVALEDFDPWLLDRLTSLLDEAHVLAGTGAGSVAGEALEKFAKEGRNYG